MLAMTILATSLIVLSVEVAGIAGVLSHPRTVFDVAFAVSGLALAASVLSPRAPRMAPEPRPAEATDTGPGPVVLFDRVASIELRSFGLAALLLVATWIPIAWSRLALPPVAWDALTYHLMFPATWLHSGGLATPVPASGDLANTYYPLAGQMQLYWNLVSTGTDRWAGLSQLPFLVAGALAVFALARRCGAGGRGAALASLLFAAIPVALRQSVEVMLDVQQAALFAIAAFFAIRALDGSPGTAVLAWMAMGLLAGLKYSGAVLALPLVSVLVIASMRGRLGWKDHLGGPVAALAIGGYAYLRNAATFGNPFMPVRVALGSTVLLPGPVDSAAYFGAGAPRLGWSELLLSPRSGLELGCLFLPALILLVVGALAPGQSNRRALASVGAAAFLLSALLLPFREHRYFLPVLAGALALAPALFRTRGWRVAMARAVPVIVLVQAPITLAYVLKDIAILRTDAPHASGYGSGRDYEGTRYDRWAAYWSTRHEWEDRAHARSDLGDMAAAWAWIAEHTRTSAAIVAYAGINTPYPFSGHAFANEVTFVPRAGSPDATVYEWGKPPRLNADADSSVWRSNLIASGARYLCVSRFEAGVAGPDAFPIEDAWARGQPDLLVPAWEREYARIYVVRAP
ncbi:MAG TPA: glycosyltransferase family 39 protein [Candidatus Eisenbacteria bacterium]|nr:glycosyltransferase family 39 protein [Candidatus Eisenbacteria bacterium]